MPLSSSGESRPNPADEQLLATTLDQIRKTIRAKLAEIVLPEGCALIGAQTEIYQSPALRAALDAAPGQYPSDDRSLIILSLQQDRQVFLISGSTTPTDKFDISRALGGGVDLREAKNTVYTYDGINTITEYLDDGRIDTYTGEHGDPEILLGYIRESLGTCIAIETFGEQPS